MRGSKSCHTENFLRIHCTYAPMPMPLLFNCLIILVQSPFMHLLWCSSFHIPSTCTLHRTAYLFRRSPAPFQIKVPLTSIPKQYSSTFRIYMKSPSLCLKSLRAWLSLPVHVSTSFTHTTTHSYSTADQTHLLHLLHFTTTVHIPHAPQHCNTNAPTPNLLSSPPFTQTPTGDARTQARPIFRVFPTGVPIPLLSDLRSTDESHTS